MATLSLVNNTSIISFCDKECTNITSNHFKKALFNLLDTRYRLNPVSNSIYVNIDCNKMKNITLHTHILATLTNGNPYMLYFTIIDGKNVVLFIDRKKKENHTFPKIHVLSYKFAPIVFNETIMSGELVRDVNKNWFFLLDNIYVYNGKSLADANIITRYETLHTIMRDYFTPTVMDTCLLQIKRLFSYKDIRTIFNDYMPRLSYVCKGLVFYTLNPKYTNYCYELPRDEQIPIMGSEEVEALVIKQRPDIAFGFAADDKDNIIIPLVPIAGESHIAGEIITDDDSTTTASTLASTPVEIKSYAVFKVLKTDKPDIYQLYHLEKKQPKFNSIALVPNIKISKMMNTIFKDNLLDCKMRCTYSKVFERWIPKDVAQTENVNTPSQLVKIIAHLTASSTFSSSSGCSSGGGNISTP